MSKSFLFDSGPCDVWWNGATIGQTYGGIKAGYEDGVTDIKEDQQGETVVDGVFKGRMPKDIEVPLTRFTVAQLDTIFHGAAVSGDALIISNVVGESMYESAQALILKPKFNDVASVLPADWITFYKTFPCVNIELVYDNAGQRVAKFIFKIFPSQESGVKGEFGSFGTN